MRTIEHLDAGRNDNHPGRTLRPSAYKDDDAKVWQQDDQF
jgi:hypothetical protein